MRRINQAKPSPALLVAVVALMAALAGTAIGGVAVTSLNKKDKKQVTKIAKKQAKKLDKQIALLPGPQGDTGPKGDTGEKGDTGAKGEPGESPIKGEGNLDATSAETILTVPAIELEVRTDGDVDDDLNVVLFNAGTVGMAHMFPGEGNVSVITAGAGDTVTAPQDFGDGTEKHLDAVVFQGGTKVYVECVFPIDDVLCTATTYP